MHRPTLPIEGLPAWAHLNDVSFHGVKVVNTEGKGYGVVSDTDLEATDDTSDAPALLTVPHDLVLNAAAVEEYAKEDKNFRQLLDAIGRRSTRADVLLFLLVQTVLASRSGHSAVGVSNPWTEYLKFLPETVLVPTLWTEDERLLLRGTSLEAAVDAKISALDAEFGLVQEKSSDIISWNDLLWAEGASVSFTDWIRLDALYRSRCLELPRSGESMVPCVDMLNHSAAPSAYYDETPKDEVILLPRPGTTGIPKGAEITISYGADKSAAEMLFSYGFIDPGSTADSLVLPLAPFPDDPLAKAKLVAFGEAPQIHVAREEEEAGNGLAAVRWASAFAHLMCVNEEDGLEFRVLQQTDGARQLRVFWQEEDVTDQAGEFEALVQTHPLAAVVRLRVVTVVQEALRAQLERLGSAVAVPAAAAASPQQRREDCVRAAMLLREIETKLLEAAVETLEEERSSLLTDRNVVAYLGLTEAAESGLAGDEVSNEPDDFS
ncbi:hypothetical protein C8A01DRAFT_34171 [Parachaetomium inaequale]|uniref:SET domain-containing protein n=1 Tax=Parachaetomium inaequale TaxID=2588326 RepID=A0AAN6PIU5_9PEZI|nr:hypothetical protein C8A01DRAFT_34171 [Parachaetomium inaequale]